MESSAAAARAPGIHRVPERRTPQRVPIPTDAAFAAILSDARAGAEPAWNCIYREFSPAVLGYLRGQGSADAEDLTGEVFLQVVRDLHRFRGDRAAFKAWVLRIAHHRFIDDRRRVGRRPLELVAVPPERDGTIATAETEALALLGAERVHELLAALSPDQRSVLLLRIVGDLTVEEIGRVIGKRAGAVKALQRRGLLALGRRLAEETA